MLQAVLLLLVLQESQGLVAVTLSIQQPSILIRNIIFRLLTIMVSVYGHRVLQTAVESPNMLVLIPFMLSTLIQMEIYMPMLCLIVLF
jgi:hypothetical protein